LFCETRNFARVGWQPGAVLAIEGEEAVKKKTNGFLILMSLMAVPFFFGTSRAQEPKTTVLSPLGQPPAITRVPMAPRLNSLDGKTIYLVDIGFIDTHQFLTEMQQLLTERYPKTTWIVRNKIGTYFDDDPKLWAEIKEKGNGMIMGVGH
jgi:hypothetical protein